MKKLSYLLAVAVTLFAVACSEDDSNANTSLKKNELSMIVPATSGSGNALLLKDGTLANPKSGIADFNSRTAGSKLLLTYKSLGSHNGILDIAVTAYAKADDSTFTVDPSPNIDQEIYGKSFTGTFFTYEQDSTNASAGSATFAFGAAQSGATSSYQYTLTPDNSQPVSGSGEVLVNETTATFENNEDNDFIVPTGDFQISWSGSTLYLWRVSNDGGFLSYALTRN